jgi:acyl-CoA thioesterase-1
MIHMKQQLLLVASLLAAPFLNAQPANDPAYAPVADEPGLPRVLLLGDSISVGYTLPVRAALRGRANVHRPAGNCSSTGYGLTKLDQWLGAGPWDVIHFNFGLHDAKLPPEGVRHSPPELYEENLRKIVRRLKATGARLVWATTTPVPLGGNLAPNRRFGDIAAYNQVALKVMQAEGVAVDDLHAAVLPHLEKVGRPRDVHFTPEGSNLLAGHVAASIERELQAASPARTVVGLSMYSLRELVRAKTLDPLDYPAFAKQEFGLTAVDLWEGGLPADKLDDDIYLGTLRDRAAQNGSDLFLLMAGVVDATGATPEERVADAAKHFPSVHRAAVLGCRYLRVFVKAPPIDRSEAVARCVEALRPLAVHAGMNNVTLVIEPGSSELSSLGDFLAEVAARLADPRCRLMPDFGKLKGDVYAGTAAMMPHAAVVSAKMHNFDADGRQVDFDYARLMRIVRASGFSGIVAIEWEGKGLVPIEGVRQSRLLIERSLADF